MISINEYKVLNEPAVMPYEIDLSYLKTVSDGCLEFEKNLLESSVTDIDLKIKLLAIALSDQDAAETRLQAHSLKSLCGIIGISSLLEHFKQIELLHISDVFQPAAKEHFSDVLIIWEQVKVELQHIIAAY